VREQEVDLCLVASLSGLVQKRGAAKCDTVNVNIGLQTAKETKSDMTDPKRKEKKKNGKSVDLCLVASLSGLVQKRGAAKCDTVHVNIGLQTAKETKSDMTDQKKKRKKNGKSVDLCLVASFGGLVQKRGAAKRDSIHAEHLAEEKIKEK